LGLPNAGKSTLLNNLCGQKIAIVTPKPQTTRNRIVGIKTGETSQIIFIDTPGLHESSKTINKMMVKEAEGGISDGDVFLFISDPLRQNSAYEEEWIAKLKERGKPIIIGINKVDKADKASLLPIIAGFANMGVETIFPISARTGEGLEELEKAIISFLPMGPKLYPDDMVMEQNERFLASEVIREYVFRLTREEVPYSCMVEIIDFKERSPRLSVVTAVIWVEKESQKGIVIGKGGDMIGAIGKAAREELEKEFDRKFYLELKVKTKKDWTKDGKTIRESWQSLK